MTASRLPTYAISHGGGPWPWIKGLMPVDWSKLEAALVAIPAELGQTPRAILMVTAHWEGSAFTVSTNPEPGMVYDYGGFPPETYEIVYPAPGHPEVGERAASLLEEAGLPAKRDGERGYDHGTCVPAYVIYPDARVPVVQMSIHRSFDPALHLAAGRALAPLRDEGVLIIGSGLPSFHDLSNLGQASAEPSRMFDSWLSDAMTKRAGRERSQLLERWDSAPAARQAHPREDHFIPLLVAAGAAEGDQGVRQYHEEAMFGYTTSSGYRFGDAA